MFHAYTSRRNTYPWVMWTHVRLMIMNNVVDFRQWLRIAKSNQRLLKVACLDWWMKQSLSVALSLSVCFCLTLVLPFLKDYITKPNRKAHILATITVMVPQNFSMHFNVDVVWIAGRPGSDYPILPAVPYTNFYCDEQKYPGFFADTETRCQGTCILCFAQYDFYLLQNPFYVFWLNFNLSNCPFKIKYINLSFFFLVCFFFLYLICFSLALLRYRWKAGNIFMPKWNPIFTSRIRLWLVV